MLSNNSLSNDDNKPIPYAILSRYRQIGFKPIPLRDDSKTPAVGSTNDIYNDANYWTEKKLIEDNDKFSNIATTFGVTHTPESQTKENKKVYLHCLDIDSDNVLAILFDFLEELKSKTFVTKTKKDCGYHIYWLSHIQHAHIGRNRCKSSYEFEIKSDNSLGLCTLPPSQHRDDPHFKYQSVGLEDKIVVDDKLYEKLLQLLSNECLTNNNNNNNNNHDEEVHGREDRSNNSSNGKSKSLSTVYKNLTDTNIERVISYIKDAYQKGYRDPIVFGLSGLLFKNKIALQSAKNLICKLCDFTYDEEKSSRLEVVQNTYLKGIDGSAIKGYTQLLETYTVIHNGDEDSAKQILRNIYQTLGIKDKGEGDDNGNDHSSTTQLLIQLAQENASLFFKDQYDKAYVKAQVADHSEIIALESNKFEYYISKLYYDNTQGKVAGQESLNNAIRVLISQTLFDSVTAMLHLRVSWVDKVQSKDGKIYYDLTDSSWRCIRVTQQGWEIIQDPSVLFIRFNQKAQVEPDRNYPRDIFEKYLNLMHIKTPDHRLLIKVWTVAAFIPDIPHPISIPYGEKGSVKTTYCKFQKRLIDPDKIELLTVPQDKSEFVQQQYHNYLTVYDNIKTIPYWFSDEVCKAITGIGSSKRRLYTDDQDVIYSYKRLLIINGINNSLTEPDALDRSILKEFDRIPDEQRREEAKVEAEFEEMRPKLLGYVLDILVKALKIKATIELPNLPRMADFTVWGEAIARAMDYNPTEFVEAYYKSIGKQNVEVIDSNPLAQAIEKFVYSWYKEGAEACWQGPTSKILEKLNKVAQTYGIDTSNEFWPKAANSLTKRLRPILSNLREGLGIHIVITRNTVGKNKNTSTIRIWKQPPLPPPSPPSQNQAQNEDKIGGDTLESGDITSTIQQVSPPETIEIHAQTSDSGDSGDSRGILPTLEEEAYDNNDNEDILSKRYVVFDFEWLQGSSSSLFAAAFVDSNGNNKVLHISDYSNNTDNPEAELVKGINQELLKYDFSIGWYSTGIARYHEDTQEYLDGIDSDLVVLHNRCMANDVDSIVDFNSPEVPHIRGQTHIDLHNVFGKPMVQNTIFKNAYRTLRLDEVSKAVLATDRSAEGLEIGVMGKYKGLSGKNIQTLPVEEQKKYVLRDAELVMQLSKHNNSEVLDAMKSISEITGLDFERVCRTGISTWWAAIFDNMAYNGECDLSVAPLSFDRAEEKPERLLQQYVGGFVFQPKKGLYHDLIVADVTSLYPTMAILHNLSSETVNCECCKDDLQCRINGKDITKDCKMQKEYWICRQKEGAFPKKLKIFKEERLKQKKLGNQVKQLALKILINGGYGVFGSQYFKYYDPRVAELITAYGRYTISKMRDIAQNMGFEIVYGDTDSLFLNYASRSSGNAAEAISKFKEECNKQLGVKVEHAKTYQTAIISDKKKHYIGWTGIQRTEPDIVGMEGDKNDRPKWITTVFRQIVYDILVSNKNPIVNLERAVADLELGNVNPELLKRSSRLSKNPEEYENENDRKRKIGLAVGARKGDVIEYFESDNNKEGYSLNPQDISIRKYKIMLWKAVKDVLKIVGYDVATLEQELILDNNKEDGHKAEPPSGVAGYTSSSHLQSKVAAELVNQSANKVK